MGKGTGLGLSTIAGIVQNHEGALQVESRPGHGTTFHIFLPAVLAAPQLPAKTAPQSLPMGSGEVILIIDDDPGIRLVTEKILESHGYEVCTAADGPGGLEEFHRQRDRLRLVICDQMMPGMGGSVVLAQIHQEAPTIGLITMSGLAEELSSPNPEAESFVKILRKPIDAATLLQTVRQIIDAPVAAPAFCS